MRQRGPDRFLLKASSSDPGWGMSERAAVPNNNSQKVQILGTRNTL